MEFLFIDEDGSLSVADHIPDDVQKGHESGITTIINTAFGAVLNASNDWEEIRAIPSPPVIKHRVDIGGRASGKTARMNRIKELSASISVATRGIDE